MRSRSLLAAVLAAAALAGCQKPDVGQSCNISWNTAGDPAAPIAAELPPGGSDYFESGNLGCDGLVCIVSPAPAGSEYAFTNPGEGYCSKPCVSNADCFSSETGLTCRQMVLDPVFLQQLDAATRERYLADIQYSSYCAVPR